MLYTTIIGRLTCRDRFRGGSAISARMKPSLLDLGMAVAAGAAAAFAYTRPNVSSALAGIAIAVALVPPLCTVGIAMALGQEASVEVGWPWTA